MFDFSLAPFTKGTPTPCTLDPALFDPWDDEGESVEQFGVRTREARNRCYRCPVLFQCQSWSRDVAVGEVTGVLAGKDELVRFNERMTAKRASLPENPSAKVRERILYTPASERRLVIPSMLAAGMTVVEIAAAFAVDPHRIYDDFAQAGWPMPDAAPVAA